ncbi:MAG TPA: hypothetical protein DIS79_08355 [Bacteroidetes bacterium]|nr:hypothetical protein [Bacteroidota bacterium]HRK05319.1 hypothetical protein [Chlorobiota bacterium]
MRPLAILAAAVFLTSCSDPVGPPETFDERDLMHVLILPYLDVADSVDPDVIVVSNVSDRSFSAVMTDYDTVGVQAVFYQDRRAVKVDGVTAGSTPLDSVRWSGSLRYEAEQLIPRTERTLKWTFKGYQGVDDTATMTLVPRIVPRASRQTWPQSGGLVLDYDGAMPGEVVVTVSGYLLESVGEPLLKLVVLQKERQSDDGTVSVSEEVLRKARELGYVNVVVSIRHARYRERPLENGATLGIGSWSEGRCIIER